MSSSESDEEVEINELSFSKQSLLVTVGDDSCRKWWDFMWKNHETSDATILCRESSFKVHKFILSSESTNLREKFLPKSADKTGSNEVSVDVDVDMLKLCLQFVYMGSVDVTKDQLVPVMDAAIEMKFIGLQKYCLSAISRHAEITAENCFKFWQYATDVGDERLYELFFSKALKLSDKFTFEDSFLNLQVSHVVQYLTHRHLAVTDIEERISLAVFWFKHDPDNRLQDLISVLQQMPLFAVKPWFLRHLKHCHPSIGTHPRLRQLLSGAMSEEEKDVLSLITFQSTVVSYSPIYNMTSLTLRPLTTVPGDDVTSFAACIHDNAIIVSGSGASKNKTWRFCLRNKRWKQLGDLTYARQEHTMVSGDEKVYAVGGTDVTAIEVLNSDDGSWSIVGHVDDVVLSCADNIGCLALVSKQVSSWNTSYTLVQYSLREKKVVATKQIRNVQSVSCMVVAGNDGFIFKNFNDTHIENEEVDMTTGTVDVFNTDGSNPYTIKHSEAVTAYPLSGGISLANGGYMALYSSGFIQVAPKENVMSGKYQRFMFNNMKASYVFCGIVRTLENE